MTDVIQGLELVHVRSRDCMQGFFRVFLNSALIFSLISRFNLLEASRKANNALDDRDDT